MYPASPVKERLEIWGNRRGTSVLPGTGILAAVSFLFSAFCETLLGDSL